MPFNPISSDTEGGVGGTCVLRGCVPKKLFIYGSEYTEHFKVLCRSMRPCAKGRLSSLQSRAGHPTLRIVLCTSSTSGVEIMSRGYRVYRGVGCDDPERDCARQDSAGFGWEEIPENPKLTWKTMLDAKNKEIARLHGIYKDTILAVCHDASLSHSTSGALRQS